MGYFGVKDYYKMAQIELPVFDGYHIWSILWIGYPVVATRGMRQSATGMVLAVGIFVYRQMFHSNNKLIEIKAVSDAGETTILSSRVWTGEV